VEFIDFVRKLAFNPCIGGFCAYRISFIRDLKLRVEHLASGSGLIIKGKRSDNVLLCFMDDPGCMVFDNRAICWYYSLNEFEGFPVFVYDYINDLMFKAKVKLEDRKLRIINESKGKAQVTSHATVFTFYPQLAMDGVLVIGTNLVSLVPLAIVLKACLKYGVTAMLLTKGFSAPYTISIALNELRKSFQGFKYIIVGDDRRLINYVEEYLLNNRGVITDVLKIPMTYLGRGLWKTTYRDIESAIEKVTDKIKDIGFTKSI